METNAVSIATEAQTAFNTIAPIVIAIAAFYVGVRILTRAVYRS